MDEKPECRVPTQDMIDQAVQAERDYLDAKIETLTQRLDDMDKATDVLAATVNRVPTDVQLVKAEILRLMDERDLRVTEHFEAIKRLRESETNRDQRALEAALVAQDSKTSVSVASLDRTIEKNSQLAGQQNVALADRITQINELVTRNSQSIAEIQAGGLAVKEQKVDTRGGTGTIISVLAVGMALIAIVTSIIIAVVLH